MRTVVTAERRAGLAVAPLTALAVAYLALEFLLNGFVVCACCSAIRSPPSGSPRRRAMSPDPRVERQRMSRVPQWIADRLGWPELAAVIVQARDALPAEERAAAVFLAGDYGYAGAVEAFEATDVPLRVIGTHNQYFLWGPGDPPPEVVVTFGIPRGDPERVFSDTREAAVFHCEFCYQDGMPIWIARQPRIPLERA